MKLPYQLWCCSLIFISHTVLIHAVLIVAMWPCRIFAIFCSLTERTNVGVTSYSLFDYDTATNTRFMFDLNTDGGISDLFSIVKRQSTLADNFFSEHRQDNMQVIWALLSQFSNAFDNFRSQNDWQLLDNAVSAILPENVVTPVGISESPYLFQVAWKFQQVCPLRVSFIEGNHNHTKYSSMLFNMLL